MKFFLLFPSYINKDFFWWIYYPPKKIYNILNIIKIMFKLVKFTSGNVVNNEKKITKDIVEKYGNINNSEIAENNIEISKRMDNVQFLCSSIVGWLNANPGKNLLDLEKRFRFLNNGIYLIPRESDSKDSKIFSLPKFEKQEKYYISVILSDDIDIKNYYDENLLECIQHCENNKYALTTRANNKKFIQFIKSILY